MKVTIITVAYNSERTIADTLQSVASQTHADIEHLVIDGASRDATLQVVEQHRGRVTKVVSEPDRGIYDAMNKGVRLASGDLIGFLNADDVFADADCIASIVAEAQRSESDAIYGDLVYVREDDLTAVVRLWQSGGFRRDRLKFGWMPPHPTLYVRRDAMRALGGFNDSYRIAADYDFILRCLGRDGCKASYVPRVLVRMRTGGASNRSLRALWRKSAEDLSALRRSGVGGVFTLACKNLRKLPQFLSRPAPASVKA